MTASFFIYGFEHDLENFNSIKILQEEILHFENNEMIALPFSTTKKELGWIINFQNDLYPFFSEKIIKKIKKRLEKKENCFFVISKQFAYNDLLNQFNQLRDKTENQKFYFKGAHIVRENELLNLKTNFDYNASKYFFKIVNHDYFSALYQLEDYFNSIIIEYISPVFLKQEASNLFYTLITALEDDIQIKKDFSKIKLTMTSRISRTKYLEDFSELILSTINLIKTELTFTETNASNDNNEVIDHIIYYIENNYNSQITLSSLASKFYLSYNYLSSLFTAKFGINFSDYVNQVRIKKAKELLANSNLNLSEISDQVGYTDLSYFSKVFKKETGITPSKYRKGSRV